MISVHPSRVSCAHEKSLRGRDLEVDWSGCLVSLFSVAAFSAPTGGGSQVVVLIPNSDR